MNRGIFFLMCTLLLCAYSFPANDRTKPRIDISEIMPRVVPVGTPAIAWVATNDRVWATAEPIFSIAGDTNVSARGWISVSESSIRCRVIVTDSEHINSKEKSDIWDGDSLQIGIDTSGEASEKDSSSISPYVASLTAALTKRGPELWAHYQGKYGTSRIREGKRLYPISIVRNDAEKTTVYEIEFPWTEFTSLPGFAPVIGLCVQVNDSSEKEKQRRIYWGRGADGSPRPSLFMKLAPSAPSSAFTAAVETRTNIWRSSSYGEIMLSFWSPEQCELRGRIGTTERTLPVERRSTVRRFTVRAYPGAVPASAMPFECSIVSGKKVLRSQRSLLAVPAAVIDELHRRVESLVMTSPHPYFTRHLRSIDALVTAEWNRAMFIVDNVPNAPEPVIRDVQTILDGLNAEMGDWRTFAAEGRSLLFARESWPDSTIQFALVSLPKNWDSNKTYPLIVDLHGAGPSHVLFYPAMKLRSRTNEAPQTNDEKQYFRLEPWGRGNSGYERWGKMDVFSAMSDVQKNFKIDKDRTYLTGHSMGGGGAWDIALRYPDIWAAVCPAAGGTWGTPLGIGLGQNASNLPFRIWHGDKDGAVRVSNATNMRDELAQFGNKADMLIIPGQGHDYPSDWVATNTQWLLSHVRKLPTTFSYITEDELSRGTRGIWMRYDFALSPTPRFSCSLESNAVRITSTGTTGLTVRLGENGLGYSNTVSVWWNGSNAYTGAPAEIKLGDGGGWYY